MQIVSNARTISFRGKKETASGFWFILLAALLLSFAVASCGTVSPAVSSMAGRTGEHILQIS